MKQLISRAFAIVMLTLLLSCSISEDTGLGILTGKVFHSEKALALLKKFSRLQFHLDTNLTVVQDYPVISEELLSRNIALSYQKASTFINRDLMSEFSFVNYVLPYKLNSSMPSDWRTKALSLYTVPFERMKYCTSSDSMLNICNDVDRYTKTLVKYKLDNTNENILTFDEIVKKGSGSCLSICNLNSYISRANGLPMTFDYVPAWGNQDGGHAWNVLVPNEKEFYPISGDDSGTNEKYNPLSFIISSNKDFYSYRIPPKVYRKGFIPDTTSVYLKFYKQLSNIGTTFTDLDVTSKYVKTGELNTQYYFKKTSEILVISVLNSGTWKPVSAISPKLKEFKFRDLGVENLYLISTLDFRGESFLFYLDKSANIRDFRSTKRHKMILSSDKSVLQQQVAYIDKHGWKLPDSIKNLSFLQKPSLSDNMQYELYGMKKGKWELLERKFANHQKFTTTGEYADGLYILIEKGSVINAKTRPFILLNTETIFI
ncbi:hypothetical protein DU508_17545 [Pedobacter chinensis]|uniref:Transglutaminase domain-containing protein n=1 Tax=Pedobacter chinensis TaxID=2282421 RepID=A0A369PWK4_9SPHI|nr:hypothetical protein [Pedobacter chinensis]RDC55377.1 hypothetical protein DU508_17545 [Pedobacter chinensis]